MNLVLSLHEGGFNPPMMLLTRLAFVRIESVWREVDFRGSVFEGSIGRTHFLDCDLRGAEFLDYDFRIGASMVRCDVAGGRFIGVQLDGGRFTGTNLRRARFQNVVYKPGHVGVDSNYFEDWLRNQMFEDPSVVVDGCSVSWSGL